MYQETDVETKHPKTNETIYGVIGGNYESDVNGWDCEVKSACRENGEALTDDELQEEFDGVSIAEMLFNSLSKE